MSPLEPPRAETGAERKFAPARMRRTVLEMAYAGSTVHIACAFSIIELVTVLYRDHLRYPGNDPRAEGRDYLVLSKGHGVMAQYACMREIGWLNDEHIQGYFKDGSDLKGLSDSRVPGLEVTSGSLGHGFSVGVGIAMGLQRKGGDQKVYAIVGDGELNEGPIWEGALSAKFSSFGFETVEVDGHNEAAVDAAIRQLWATSRGKPKALIARTVKGKGVPFMESDNRWHYTRLNAQTFTEAIDALGLPGAST
jgi:transketolase